MTSGLPGRSLPLRMSIACSRWTNVPFSFVRVTKYIVCDDRVDDRCAADPDVAGEVQVGAAGLADVGAGHGHDAGRGVRVVDAPERSGGRRIVGVEGVDAVVVRRDVDDVADADARNVDALDVQRLPVDLVVDGALEELAELADVDVGRREHHLGQIGSGPCRVVVLGDHARLREGRLRQKERERESECGRCP